jgi:hypothetical protein
MVALETKTLLLALPEVLLTETALNATGLIMQAEIAAIVIRLQLN